jgi:hypothetical protein
MNWTKLAHLSHFTDNLWNSVWYWLMDNIQTYGTSTLFRSKALNVASALSSLSFSRCNELLPPINHFMSTLVTLTPEISSHSFIPIYTNRCTHKPAITSSCHEPTSTFFLGEFSPLGGKQKIQCNSYKGFLWKNVPVTRFQRIVFFEIAIFRQ